MTWWIWMTLGGAIGLFAGIWVGLDHGYTAGWKSARSNADGQDERDTP